ncbi:sugar phosphate nucleotidyltransferase [Agarivorans aestuarii]|uniref:sugar phosphate nucleotidyltransferase n=1 Tax=Agarivorans aestuarii TaxID=1563703 RepID=UPI001C80D2C8|nr:sugar phosphate nucleotidyltransferase [Agarivorans aestuarii]
MDASYKSITICSNATILEALRAMDENRVKLLITLDSEGGYESLVSIGDIQRAIIKGHPVSEILNIIEIEEKVTATTRNSNAEIKKMMIEMRCDFMPVLDDFSRLERVIFWSDISKSKHTYLNKKNDIPVVIMAGGKGTRLKPISNVLPKPLIPVGDKTIIEEIIDRFKQAGSNKFHISVNYKKEMIKYYLDNLYDEQLIDYFSEDKPLGTAGSLSLLKGRLNETFYVTNCDILIDQDLNEIYQYHLDNSNEITLVAVIKVISVPYGVIKSGKDGLIEAMEEKPELTFKINAGIYMLEPGVLTEIPDDEFFHITDLIEKVRLRGGRVGVFPISERSWSDIGEWPEYIKTVRKHSAEGNEFQGL